MLSTPPSLLEQLRQPGNNGAWVRLVRLYTPLLWRWARRLGLQPPDAADLVQDVFFVVWQKLPEFTYRPGGSFRAWLYTVLVNKWRDRLRRRTERPVDADDPALAGLAAPEGAAEEAEYRTQLAGRAMELIRGEFQPATWSAFWECAVRGRAAAEVALELGMKPNAVYQAKFRVLRRLRDELEGLLD
jgi:RNA polymerase sigma-70 factor (ECF subfamily)